MAQDSSKPDFWEVRYKGQVMPWDAGRVPGDLVTFAQSLAPHARILIPGCGSAYEALYLAEQGFQVLAIDFSETAIEAAKKNLGGLAEIVKLADFFEFDADAPFDVVYERAFLCALPPRMWDRYPARVASLLKPGGRLAGYFFFDETVKGPPFGTSPQELDKLLSPQFDKNMDAAVLDSIPVFAGKERWQVWQRR
jgi:SAM-dependent methyltransferase